jgi:hypothetical protein
MVFHSTLLFIRGWEFLFCHYMYIVTCPISVNNCNGFWIGFINTSLQLQPIITAHNQLLSKTRSILTGLRVSSTVTNDKRRIICESSRTELTSRQTEYRSPSRTVRLLLRLFVAVGTCLQNRCLAVDYSASSFAVGTCVNFVASSCLAMDHSGFQASCHNMLPNSYEYE